MTACIIIPTTGAVTLRQAVNSAINQTYNSTVLVVIDGTEFENRSMKILEEFRDVVQILKLPENTGANGYYGHRIYAATSFLVNQDFLFYLDQDNWYDNNHVESQLHMIHQNNWDWCHSLRKIVSSDGDYILDDNCESLGRWPAYTKNHLVDTSCFCVSKEVATKIGQTWYAGWGGDRQFLSNANHYFPNWGGTGQHTLNYRLAGNAGSVTKEFFEQGNSIMAMIYNGKYPWHL